MRLFSLFLFLSSLALAGCGGKSTYDVRGLGLNEVLDAGETLTVEQDTMQYSIARNAAGLSVIAFNGGEKPVTLVEPGSVAVDPGGRRHVLVERTLLPRTSTRFDLPPRVTGSVAASEDVMPDQSYDEPGILLGPRGGATLRTDAESRWRWSDGQARLLLIWKREGEQPWRHELTVEKRRV